MDGALGALKWCVAAPEAELYFQCLNSSPLLGTTEEDAGSLYVCFFSNVTYCAV